MTLLVTLDNVADTFKINNLSWFHHFFIMFKNWGENVHVMIFIKIIFVLVMVW